MNAEKLKGKIAERGTTIEALAKSANMDKSTFYRKLQPESKGFTVGEAKLIVLALEMNREEADAIFYGE